MRRLIKMIIKLIPILFITFTIGIFFGKFIFYNTYIKNDNINQYDSEKSQLFDKARNPINNIKKNIKTKENDNLVVSSLPSYIKKDLEASSFDPSKLTEKEWNRFKKKLNHSFLKKMSFQNNNMLNIAINASSQEMVTYLLSIGFDINQDIKNYYNRPIAHAVRNGDIYFIKFLVEQGALLANDLDSEKDLLYYAFQYNKDNPNKDKLVEYLLDNGYDINDPQKYFTAMTFGQSQYLDTIIEKIDPNIQLTEIKNNFEYILENSNDEKYLQIMIDKYDFESNSTGFTVLHAAARNENISNKTYQLLIDKTNNINEQDVAGMTPLMHAVVNFDFDKTELLLKNGASLNITSALTGRNVYDYANTGSVNITEQQEEQMNILLEKYSKNTN